MQRLGAVIALVLPLGLWAQIAEVRTYGASGDDQLVELRETDTGYVLAGTTASSPGADTDFYLLALDQDLNVAWSQTFGAGGVDQCSGLDRNAAGECFLSGYTNETPAGDYDVSVIKTDALGVKLWEVHFGGLDWDLESDVVALDDGGFALLFTSYTADQGTDLILLRGDADGNLLWQITLGDAFNQTAHVLTLGPTGELVAGGTWATGEEPDSERAWMATFDLDGNLIAEGFFGEVRTELFDAHAYQDGVAAVGYYTGPDGDRDHYVLKANPDLSLAWIRLDGDPDDDAFYGLTPIETGLITVGAGNGYGAGGYAAMVHQRTLSGWWVESANFGPDKDEAAYDVIVDSAGRTVVCGSSDSYAEFGDLDGYLIRFEGTVLPDEFELEELDVEDGALDVLDLEALGIHVRTSSSGDRMLHAADLSTLRVVVTDLRGNLLYDASQAGVHRVPLSEWAAGMYAVRVMAGHQMGTAVWSR